jgi:catechol 2,3-dioxygenase-like lactoylglutathione lyase family enzyme
MIPALLSPLTRAGRARPSRGQRSTPPCRPSRRVERRVKVKRIVSNVATPDIDRASAFYEDVLGLKVLMDLGWIRTYGSSAKMTLQVSVMSEGGSGTPVPDISIEVDNVEQALMRAKKAGIPIEYGPATEPWGVRRFFVRDPFGKLINILQHE